MINPWITASDTDFPSSPYVNEAIRSASFILWSLSGQKYGGISEYTEQYVCESTGAPTGCVWDPGTRGWWNPSIGAFTFIADTLSGGRFSTGTSIRMRQKPVRRVLSITVGGSAVPSGSYKVYDQAILANVSAFSLCDGPVVTYTAGSPPPELGRQAAITLANEFIQLWTNGPSECRLPARTTSISRQGLSINMFDPQDFLDKGQVGLYEVDLFLRAVNPSKSLMKAKVFSPDLPRGYRSS